MFRGGVIESSHTGHVAVVDAEGKLIASFGDPKRLTFARMARPEVLQNPVREDAVRRITDAMIAAPEMVGGKNRYCTDLMNAFQGRLFGKAGAEAVYCVGDRTTGYGFAIKIEDGGPRAVYAVMNEVLRQLGVGTDGPLEALAEYTNPDILNMSGKAVGKMETSFDLQTY
nr:asparaginase [Tumebacillus flagellatus]